MALAAILIGSLVGFGNFVIALTFFQTGFPLALAVYSGSGLSITVFILLLSSFPRDPIHVSSRGQFNIRQPSEG